MSDVHFWELPSRRAYSPKEVWGPAACGMAGRIDCTSEVNEVTCDSCRAVMASVARAAGVGAAPVDAEAGGAEAPKAGGTEAVDHPPHYVGAAPGSLECIDAIDALVSQMKTESGFYAAQVLKYMWRHEKKGKPLEDLKKAQWYLNRLIKKMEGK